MAASAGRKIRKGMFGIALCFLAALFFVEVKTAWADTGNHSPIDIAAAKARAVDRSQAVPERLQVKQPGCDHSAPAFSTVLDLTAFRLAPEFQRIALPLGQTLARIPASFPFAQFDRPPPARD
jgi:hypothetical protein